MYLQPFPGNCGIQVLTGLSIAAFDKSMSRDHSKGIAMAMQFARNNTHCRYLIATFNLPQEEEYTLCKHFEACGWEPVMHKEGRINPNTTNRIWVYMVDIRSDSGTMKGLWDKWTSPKR